MAACTLLAGADASVLAFDQNVPESPASQFEQAPDEPSESVFHSFVPPSTRKAIPTPTPPEADLKAYKDGRDAYEKGDFETARKYWEGLADRGDVFAQWRLGNMYRTGQGGKVDHAKALQYYQMAAAQHEDVGRYTAKTRVTVDAMVQVARYYENGLKSAQIPQNAAYAQKLYRGTATHFRHPGAQHRLGLMYLRGTGIAPNPSKGLRWLALAAQKSYAPAQAALGDVYWEGKVVRQDRARALMWYMLAQESADPARDGEIIERFNEMLSDVDETERKGAQSLVVRWHKQNSDKYSER